MGDIGRGLSSQLSTAPYLTGGHYARSPGTGGKFTAPLPLAIGAMSWALNTLQPSLGATATTSAEKLSVVKAEVAFAFLLFLWGAYWNYRGHVRRLSRRAYAESAYPWTGNGKPEDFPQRDWTTASEPPYGWSLLELASSAGSALASSAEPAISPSAEPRRPPMASFDATSSAVPDSLLLARQADRLARQATNTVMQDTISRPALGDSSNTLSVEALVKQGGRAKAPRRICHGCVALRNEGEALKREVLRLRSGMKAMQARLEALGEELRRALDGRADAEALLSSERSARRDEAARGVGMLRADQLRNTICGPTRRHAPMLASSPPSSVVAPHRRCCYCARRASGSIFRRPAVRRWSVRSASPSIRTLIPTSTLTAKRHSSPRCGADAGRGRQRSPHPPVGL